VSDHAKGVNEDLEKALNQVEQVHQEWMAALDVVEDPIFLHDKDFRILRCNKAYQQRAGIPFKQIIGQLYYEIFPKTHAPLRHCLQAMEKTASGEEEVPVGDTLFRSRSSVITDDEGNYLYSIHTLEDITARKQAESNLAEQFEELRRWHDTTLGREGRILDLKREVNDLLGQTGKNPRYPSAESPDTKEE
jgi:PAS domain S-box-containing protein